MTTQIDTESLLQCSPVLGLISRNLVRDPEWSINLLHPVASQLMVQLLRQQRETASNLNAAISAALQQVNYGACEVRDWIAAAHLLAKAERLGEALFWVDRSLTQEPTAAEYMRFRASLLERMGRLEEATQSATLALAFEPGNEQLKADLSRVERALLESLRNARSNPQAPDQAIAAAMQLTQYPSASAADWQFLARLFAATGRVHEALGALDRASHVDAAATGTPEYQFLLSQVLERQGRLEAALGAARLAVAMSPDNVEIAAHCARIESHHWDRLRSLRDTQTDPLVAIESGLKLAHRPKPQVEDCLALAQLLAKQERLLEALHWADRALSLRPAESGCYRLQASLLERLGRYRQGYRAARRACAFDPRNAELARDARRMRLKWLAQVLGISSLVARHLQRGLAYGAT